MSDKHWKYNFVERLINVAQVAIPVKVHRSSLKL